jgi:hypothetical protein
MASRASWSNAMRLAAISNLQSCQLFVAGCQ